MSRRASGIEVLIGRLDMSEGGNPYLRAAIFEVVENQLANNDPPETRRTYERLMREGHSEQKAKDLIACATACAVTAEKLSVMKRQEPYNHERFVQALYRLPELPE